MCLYFSDSWSVSFSLFSNLFTLIVPVGEFHYAVLTIRVFMAEILGCLFDVFLGQRVQEGVPCEVVHGSDKGW